MLQLELPIFQYTEQQALKRMTELRMLFYGVEMIEKVCRGEVHKWEAIGAELIDGEWSYTVEDIAPIRENMIGSIGELEAIAKQKHSPHITKIAKNAFVEIHLAFQDYRPWFLNN